MENKVVFLCGLPGSGKSTWGRNHFEGNTKWILASTDFYIEEKAKKAGKTYNEMFQSTIKSAEENLEQALKTAINHGFDVLYDQTNITKKGRLKKLGKFPADYKKICVVFTTSEEILDRVNEERKTIGRAIPDEIFKSMKQSFQMPSKDEGWDEIIIVERNDDTVQN